MKPSKLDKPLSRIEKSLTTLLEKFNPNHGSGGRFTSGGGGGAHMAPDTGASVGGGGSGGSGGGGGGSPVTNIKKLPKPGTPFTSNIRKNDGSLESARMVEVEGSARTNKKIPRYGLRMTNYKKGDFVMERLQDWSTLGKGARVFRRAK